MGAIGKRDSENDVVWITLQARQLKWRKVNIPKVKGYGTDAMSIFYDNPNHLESFLNLTIFRTEGEKTSVPIVVMLPSILGPIFYGEGKWHGSCKKL